MKKEEIEGIIKDRFKKIDKLFHKAIDNFELGDIREFRTEIRKLKSFLHLVSMESEDGLSYRVTRRMKTVYGYLGILQNLQLQIKEIKEYVKRSSKFAPVYYLNRLENKLENWKTFSKDVIDPNHDFLNNEKEILAKLPGNLTENSINRFIHYTFYELQVISVHQDEESLNNVRKFMEDIYYNLPFLKPYLIKEQGILFDEKEVRECVRLLSNFQDKSTVVMLLQTFRVDGLDEYANELLKQMEDDWLNEKYEMKIQLAAKLDAMHITSHQLKEFFLKE